MTSRYRLALLWFSVAVCACGAPEARRACAPLAVMPLGDSITESEHGHASYRYWLDKAFQEQGRLVDFVGSGNGVYRGTPLHSDFDADHEGHWGFTTDEIRREIDRFAERSSPDLVLLMLGTNDGARDLRATRENLTAIVESLRAHRPGVVVLLAQVPPVAISRLGDTWEDVGLLNTAFAGLVPLLDQPSARVVLVDQWTGFDALRDTYDGVHPNERGEKKLAARWFDAITASAPWDGVECPAS